MQIEKQAIALIASYTDFGLTGPYQGQMNAVLATQAPLVPHITLMADAPMFDPESAGILLASLCEDLPDNSLVLAVVDPGVGGGRRPLMIRTERNLFVGPDNGLFIPAIRRAAACEIESITWRPERLSESFHGRDLFAPVAAKLATGQAVTGAPVNPQALVGSDLQHQGHRVIYVDHYGNAVTSIRADALKDDDVIPLGEATLHYAHTFDAVPTGRGFWYRNSMGLIEFAVNRGSAAELYRLALGSPVEWRKSGRGR
jgi:S-adenosylmethionine hydrolase